MTPPRRVPEPNRSRTRGIKGERLAAAHYQQEGYRLVAQNQRLRGVEIDLLLQHRRLLVAVEVKSRTDHPAPERMVELDKFDRLRQALRRLAPLLGATRLRIDVLAIRWLDPAPELVRFCGTEFS